MAGTKADLIACAIGLERVIQAGRRAGAGTAIESVEADGPVVNISLSDGTELELVVREKSDTAADRAASS